MDPGSADDDFHRVGRAWRRPGNVSAQRNAGAAVILAEFAIVILYGQLMLAAPAGPPVGLLWSDEEVAQGFAWDRAAVAFGLPDHDGTCFVRLETGPSPVVAGDALWVVATPFTATGPTLEIGTILLEHTVAVVPGPNQNVLQAPPGAPANPHPRHIRLTPSEAPTFAILKRGSLDSDVVLRRQADLVPPSSR